MRKLPIFLSVILSLGLVLAACTTPPSGQVTPPAATTGPVTGFETATPAETVTMAPVGTENPQASATPVTSMETATTAPTEALPATEAVTASPVVTGTQAIPATGAKDLSRVSNLLDQPVVDSNNQEVGTIQDVAVDLAATRVAYFILKVQGASGAQPTYIPVPWEAFRLTNGQSPVFTPDPQTLQGAPTIDLTTITFKTAEDWQSKYGSYWDTALGATASGTATPAATIAPATGITATATTVVGAVQAGMHGILTTRFIIGQQLKLGNGDVVGQVKDIILDLNTGQVTYVLVSPGEALGMGQKLIPIPVQLLSRDETNGIFSIPLDPDTLKNVPTLDLNNLPNTANPAWADAIRSFWETFLNNR